MDEIIKVQAWIVANETVAAEQNAWLVEQMFYDNLRNFCQEINETERKYRSGCGETANTLA